MVGPCDPRRRSANPSTRENDAPFLSAGASAESVAADIATWNIRRVLVKRFADSAPPIRHPTGAALLKSLRAFPQKTRALLNPRTPASETMPREAFKTYARCEAIGDLLTSRPDLVDFAAAHVRGAQDGVSAVPFDRGDLLPRLVPAEPKRRAALFLHNSYYHFNCLADGLRRRGWDTMTVSVEDPNSAQQQFYHGEDLNLFDPDPQVRREKIRAFFRTVPERFGVLHFHGMGQASFFPELFENAEQPIQPPFDFVELRRHRMIIGFLPTGCHDGAPQSAISRANR